MMNEMVTITRKEYNDLLKDQLWRIAMEGAGVDNWPGYDYGIEYYCEELERMELTE